MVICNRLSRGGSQLKRGGTQLARQCTSRNLRLVLQGHAAGRNMARGPTCGWPSRKRASASAEAHCWRTAQGSQKRLATVPEPAVVLDHTKQAQERGSAPTAQGERFHASLDQPGRVRIQRGSINPNVICDLHAH